MRLKFKNYARRTEQERFEWRVFVDEPPHVLDGIDAVIYLLPPTFPHPSRMVEDRKGGFAVEGIGVNEFVILATVVYKDGPEETQQHRVDLSQPWPAEPVSA